MAAVGSGLVEIVREFLAAHGVVPAVSERYRAGAGKLCFDGDTLTATHKEAVMKRIVIAIVAAMISTSAAANCHTIFVGGKVVTCCTYGTVTTCM